jgi:hypothetical protein
MITEYTDYVLAKRRNAIMAVVLFSLLPLLNIIAYLTLNLVTLQRGIRAGAEILLALTLANILAMGLSYYFGTHSEIYTTLEMIAYFNVGSFAAAALLRTYRSWFLTIECACYLGLLIILITHFAYPDLTAYWLELLSRQSKLLQSLFNDTQINHIEMETMRAFARNATGIRALTIITSILSYLVVARWLQTRRTQPGLLRQEMHTLRTDYISLAIVGAVMVGSYFGIPTAQDMHLVAILPMLLTGLSITHHFAASRPRTFLLLMSFYLVFSLFSTLMLGLLIFLAILDRFIDIRGKYNGYNTA